MPTFPFVDKKSKSDQKQCLYRVDEWQHVRPSSSYNNRDNSVEKLESVRRRTDQWREASVCHTDGERDLISCSDEIRMLEILRPDMNTLLELSFEHTLLFFEFSDRSS